MLKAAGIFLIAAAGAGMGFSKSRELTVREQQIKNFLQLAGYLKGAVRCGNASFPEAFEEIARRFEGEYSEFLRKVSRTLRSSTGQTLGEIFGTCAKESFVQTAFSREEKELVFSLGERLGYLDREMQLRQIEGFETELSAMLLILREELPEKKKLCRSLGILGGLLLGILLW